MTIPQCTNPKGAQAPQHTFSKTFVFLIALAFAGFFQSCDPAALVDTSKKQKWDNAYLWFEPGNMESIYVSDDANIKHAQQIPNDSEYLIEWEKSGETYSLKVTSYNQEIDFAWFTGYDAASSSEEIPWIKTGHSIELVSSKLKPAENGKYQVSISDDLKN